MCPSFDLILISIEVKQAFVNRFNTNCNNLKINTSRYYVLLNNKNYKKENNTKSDYYSFTLNRCITKML